MEIEEKKNGRKYNNKLNVIGSVIRYYREKNGLSLTDLSKKLQLYALDIPKNSLHRLENGDRIITDYELAVFSKIFNVTTDTLLNKFLKEIE